MQGLQGAIGLSVVHPTWQRTRPDDPEDPHCGWAFASEDDPPLPSPAGQGSFSCAGCIPDTINGARNVRDLYDLACGGPAVGVYLLPHVQYDFPHEMRRC